MPIYCLLPSICNYHYFPAIIYPQAQGSEFNLHLQQKRNETLGTVDVLQACVHT